MVNRFLPGAGLSKPDAAERGVKNTRLLYRFGSVCGCRTDGGSAGSADGRTSNNRSRTGTDRGADNGACGGTEAAADQCTVPLRG